MSASKEGILQGVLVYISVCNFLFHKDHLDKDTEKKKEIPLGTDYDEENNQQDNEFDVLYDIDYGDAQVVDKPVWLETLSEAQDIVTMQAQLSCVYLNALSHRKPYIR